ncbi:MAG: hypothetical protein JRE12_06055 [Deltaproteobacteria bacterium]|nr:hypothetical protein [Deltaproteobacteria bacterium]
MEIFAENSDRIEDISFLAELMWQRVYTKAPEEFKPLLLPGLEGAVDHAAKAYQARY